MGIATNVNIEIIRGCRNTKCKSWQSSCKHFGPVREMPIEILHGHLKALSNYDITNIALYGRGDALEHHQLEQCFGLVKNILPKVTTFLNVDGNSMTKTMPHVDYLNVCHKETICHPPFSTISHIPKVTHSFLVKKITYDLLDEIDVYIGETINLNPQTLYAIGSLWNIEFGVMPPHGTFVPIETEEGIPLVPAINPQKYPRRKIYIDVDGIVRKCLFSETVYPSMDSLFSVEGNNCDCEGCGMDVFTYKIQVREGGGENGMEVDS